MKGLVLSGGRGSRLRPLTYSGAKQLVPVANRPVLFYVIDNLVRAGVSDIGVIISPKTGDEVRRKLGDGSAWGARFTFLTQPEPRGLAHAVQVARDYLGPDDFVMCLGDNLVGSEIRAEVQAFREDRSATALVLLKHVDNPSAFGVAELDERGTLVRLVEKPRVPPSHLALIGIYMFRASVFEIIDRIRPSARGELEITDALSAMIAGGGRVRYSLVESWWLDTGKKDDLLAANATVLEHLLEPVRHGMVDEASQLAERVSVEEGARVIRSSIDGPSVIGKGATVIDSHIGPHTSIGDDAQVIRSEVDGSVILEGSVITDVPRLTHSLIGKRVVIRPAGEGPLSLVVGDDCLIELS